MKTRIQQAASLLLVLVLLLSLVPETFAYGECSSWAKESLDEINELGLLPAEFDQADMRVNITRQELCHIAVTAYRKLTGREAKPSRTNYFKDTTDADVCAAYELGIVTGTGDGKFSPARNLTRQELFAITCNLFRSVGWTDDEILELFKTFSDYGKVSSWAVESAKTMLEVGVIYGNGSGQLNPGGTTSVEQALAMFLRAYHYIRDWQSTFLPETGEDFVDPEPLAEHMYGKVSTWALDTVNVTEAYGFIPERLRNADFTRDITREELCEVAVKVYIYQTGDTSYTGNNYFSDTTNVNINIAYEKGLVSGTGGGKFNPTRSITRQELFRIVYNLLTANSWERLDNTHELFAQFSDSGSVAAWAKPSAKIMLQLDLVKGSDGKLLPLGTTTRQEAAILFYRAYRYISIWYADHPLDPDYYPGHVQTATTVAQQAVALAQSKLGCRYVYGDEGPDTFDCSGLVYWVYHTQLGFSMGRTATAQWKNGVQVAVDKSGFANGNWGNLLPGDLVYFASSPGSSSIGHIGIYEGNGYFIHASTPTKGVIRSRLSENYYVARFYGARRISY